MLSFVDEVCRRYEFETAHGLFVQTDVLASPDSAQPTTQKLSKEWKDPFASVVIIPMLTPRYLRDLARKSDLSDLFERATNQGDTHVLALLWQSVEGIELEEPERKLYERLCALPWIDVSSTAELSAQDTLYRSMVRKVVSAMRDLLQKKQ